jgi:hypothetical protein
MHLTSSVNLDILFVALLHAAKSQNPHSTGNLLDLLYFSATLGIPFGRVLVRRMRMRMRMLTMP